MEKMPQKFQKRVLNDAAKVAEHVDSVKKCLDDLAPIVDAIAQGYNFNVEEKFYEVLKVKYPVQKADRLMGNLRTPRQPMIDHVLTLHGRGWDRPRIEEAFDQYLAQGYNPWSKHALNHPVFK